MSKKTNKKATKNTIFSGCSVCLKVAYDGPQKDVKWF